MYFYLNDDELEMLDSNGKAEKLSRSEYVRFKIRTATMLPTLTIDYNNFAKIAAALLEKMIAIDELTKCSKMVDISLLRQTLSEISMLSTNLKETIITEKENQNAKTKQQSSCQNDSRRILNLK